MNLDPMEDPDWLDRQYNNRARIPGHAALFERWHEASVLARRTLPVQLDLSYGEGPDEVLDVFPAPHPGAPVLVFLHGGYWRALDKADHSFLAPAFHAAGAMVVIPNYSLCPKVRIDDIVAQMTRAVAWVFRNAAAHGGDPSRVALAGHSAGGHLAALLLCRDEEVREASGGEPLQRRLAGALSISGLYDLEPLRHAPFIRDDLQLDEAAVRRLSPAGLPPPRQRPLHAVAGGDESEEFLRQNRLIRDRWGEQAVPVCETLARHHHLDVLHDLADPQGRLHHLALRLLGLA